VIRVNIKIAVARFYGPTLYTTVICTITVINKILVDSEWVGWTPQLKCLLLKCDISRILANFLFVEFYRENKTMAKITKIWL